MKPYFASAQLRPAAPARRTLLLLLFFLGAWPLAGWAAHITGALPITNRIIALTFVDGTIQYHTLGQNRYDDQVTLFAGGRLSTAQSPGAYAVRSTDDADFGTGTGRAPVSVGVNVRVEQTWAEDVQGRPTDVRTTAVYLYLPASLKRGKTYTIATGSLASNATSVAFTYDEGTARSEAVHVNNLGYVPGAAKKYGYVYAWLGDRGGLDLADAAQLDPAAGRGFRLLRTSDRAAVFSGTYAFRKPKTQAEFGQYGTANNNFLGADAYECDFSGFNTPGEYVLAVDGVGCSFPFSLGVDVYREPFYWVMKGLFENRSGIALTTPTAQYNRPAPHRPGVTPGFHLYYSTARHYDLSSDDANPADVPALDAATRGELTATWGWYQDAGDWDAYATHAKVPGYLMNLYEANPAAFNNFRLDIPESAGEPAGTALPDLLDEARWLPRFYKRLKDELVAKGWGSGGVGGGRVFGDLYNPELNAETGKGSWQDTRKWVVTGEDPWMTYQYAALAAQLAYLVQANGFADPENIDWRAEAIAAWTWAQTHTRAGDETPKWGYNLALYRMHAAAALYRLTGQAAPYETAFIADLTTVPTNGNVGIPTGYAFADDDDNRVLALAAYAAAARVQPAANAAAQARVASILLASADFELGDAAFPSTLSNRATRWGGNWWLPMGIGQTTTPYIQTGVLAQVALAASNPAKTAEWLANTYTTADYFLGTNPLNMTMISGLGERYPSQIFHMDSWYLLPNGAVKKGIIPYGNPRDCNDDLGGCGGYPGPYKYYYGLYKAYPAPFDAGGNQARPGHERYMPSRTAPLANEFTIHQTQTAGALVYGYLYARTGTTTPPPTAGSGTGLLAEYFNNAALSGAPALTRVDAQVNFDWGQGSPAPSTVNTDNFSARWTGQVEAPVSGAYTFFTVSDDGVRLWVNGALAIDNWTPHAPTTNVQPTPVSFVAGQKYDLRLEYFEAGGGAVAALRWAYPGQAATEVPTPRLYPAASPPPPAAGGTGLLAEYFNNAALGGAPALTRLDAQVNFDWGGGSPAPGVVNADNFSARWTGQVEAPVSGAYTFSTVSDDGVRLWVNGALAIDNWTDHAPTTDVQPAPVSFVAGQRYDLRLEFYERGGGATAVLRWAYPGQAATEVPTPRLYPATPALLATAASAAAQAGFVAFPNPARGAATVRCAQPLTRLTLVNALGQVVRELRPVAGRGPATELSVPLQGVAAGLYTLRGQTAAGPWLSGRLQVEQ